MRSAGNRDVLAFDADNTLAPDYLSRVNDAVAAVAHKGRGSVAGYRA